jgi:hypothetical protein
MQPFATLFGSSQCACLADCGSRLALGLALIALSACGNTANDATTANSGGNMSSMGGRSQASQPPVTGGYTSATGGSRSGNSADASLGCGNRPAVTGTQAVYDVAKARAASPDSLDFFEFPWPEVARSSNELSGFPNPASAKGCDIGSIDPNLAPLVTSVDPQQFRQYIADTAHNFLSDGPNNAAIYIRFDGPLAASLPTPLQSLNSASSTVLLANIDGRAARGRIVPVLAHVFERSRYLKPHTLSILPHPGFPLEPGALHAAVVRRSLGDAQGQPLGSSATFEAMKQTGDCAVDADHAKAFAYLQDQLGIALSDIAAAAVFRAGYPTAALTHVLDDINTVASPAQLANPSVAGVTLNATDGYYLIDGAFETLIYQNGAPPYVPPVTIGFKGSQPTVTIGLDATSTSGAFLQGPVPSAAGGVDTTVSRTERLAFRLSIPTSRVSSNTDLANIPVVIYGAGTGGTINDPIDARVVPDLAKLGVAVFSTTPVMHFERAHVENLDSVLVTELSLYDQLTGQHTYDNLVNFVQSGDLFFNPLNIQAAKGNSLQAAVDYAWQARWLSEARLAATIDGSDRTLSFEPQQIVFFGHSQGGSTGPLLAASHDIGALVLSAPSGHLPSNLLGKTKPSDVLSVANMMGYIVCDDASEPLDVNHPFMNLLMHWFEEADAANYAPLLIAEAMGRPKHVFVVGGTEDHLAAPASHNAVTTSARLQQLAPQLAAVPGQALLAAMLPSIGYATTYSSLSGNFTANRATYTGAFRQYHDPTCKDDHFVFQCNAQARSDWANFFATLGNTAPRVP